MSDIDQTAQCVHCRYAIEHFAGEPGNEFMTPFWRHVDSSGNRAHGADPDPDTIRDATEVSR